MSRNLDKDSQCFFFAIKGRTKNIFGWCLILFYLICLLDVYYYFQNKLCMTMTYGVMFLSYLLKVYGIFLPPENLVLPTQATVPLRLLGRTWILSPTINQPKTDFFIRKKRRFPSKCHVDHRTTPSSPVFYNRIENKVGRIIFCLFVISLGQVRLYQVLSRSSVSTKGLSYMVVYMYVCRYKINLIYTFHLNSRTKLCELEYNKSY